MRDLYKVRAYSQNEPFLAREMVDLLEVFGEGSLEARWATLTTRSKVWADGAEAQLFCLGVLCPPLTKEIYTTPSEVLLNNTMMDQDQAWASGWGLDDAVGPRREFLGDSPKGS
ncbi:hypothetical protein BHE74_00008301 [Ensete ventricosum]|nr:hypothetical protein GW17_00027528 [Ensete ventricosum]RWW83198.1 hypothetical protein BHE74_00008301 [Ensete ventricosum]RZR92888.1 hypothetical protein BHM03_00021264 [Ensete ventricosum]